MKCGTCKAKTGHTEGCAFAIWNRAELVRIGRRAASDPHWFHVHWPGRGDCRKVDGTVEQVAVAA